MPTFSLQAVDGRLTLIHKPISIGRDAVGPIRVEADLFVLRVRCDNELAGAEPAGSPT